MNNDLISREALRKEVTEKVNFTTADGHIAYNKMLKLIDNAPPVETFTLEDMQNIYDAGVDSVIGKYDKAKGEWIIIKDEKYGDKKINALYRKDHGITSQMLACTKMVFPADLGLSGISGMTVETDVPDDFNKVMLCQPGIQGV